VRSILAKHPDENYKGQRDSRQFMPGLLQQSYRPHQPHQAATRGRYAADKTDHDASGRRLAEDQVADLPAQTFQWCLLFEFRHGIMFLSSERWWQREADRDGIEENRHSV